MNASDLRAENQQLLSQLAQMRVDFDNAATSTNATQLKEPKEVVNAKTEAPEPKVLFLFLI